MNKIREYASGMLAALALAVFCVPGQAQTTNFIVNNFNTDQVTGLWGNWFGGVYQSVFWDSTMDAAGNPSSGSMMVNLLTSGGDQYVLYDGENAGWTANLTTTFTNLSFDILFSGTSAVRTNTSAAGADGSTGVGSLDYGDMRVGSSFNWDQEWFYYFAIPATNGLGLPNTNVWTHISISLSNVVVQNPNLATMNDILFGIDGANYGNHPLVGPQTYWVDNIQFIGPVGGIQSPPPLMSVKKSVPALRLFGGSGGQYSRSQLTTFDENQSWIGDGTTYPVSYSFKLLSVPTNPGNLDMHIFFIPLNFLNGEAINGNHDMDYHVLNALWLRIQGGVGSDQCTADITWKTNAGYQNPTHTDLLITNPVAVGTWTITFNNTNSGMVTAPGASPVPFTLSDPNIVADFGNPMILSFGNQCNGVTANQGVPNDWTKISVTGVAGLNENDDFTTDAYIDPFTWDVSNSNTPRSVVLVTNGAPYWVTWTAPSTGFGLGVSTNVNSGPWKLPEYYNSYADGTNLPSLGLQGRLNWALVPVNCLPTVDGLPQTGQQLAPNAFFRLLASPQPAE